MIMVREYLAELSPYELDATLDKAIEVLVRLKNASFGQQNHIRKQ